MVTLRASLVVLLMAAALGGGCVVHPHPHRAHEPVRPRVVVVQAGHHHSRHCGHYFHRGRWYHLHGHVHGRGCSHVYLRGVWTLAWR